MDHDAKEFFRSFFAELEHRAVPYVILHSYQNFPERMDSDIDYAVRDADIPQVHAILNEVATRTGWLVAQTLQYDIGSHYSVVVNPERPGMALKLDRCSHYTRNGCLFIRDETLLEGRKTFNGFSIPTAAAEFIYMLAKVFAKGKAIAGYLPRLRELWSAEPQRSEQLFQHVFGSEAGNLANWFNRPPADWNKLSIPMHARNRYRASQRLLEWGRRGRRFSRPTGLRIVVLGDDSDHLGKLISRIRTLEEPLFRRQMQVSSPANPADLLRQFVAYRRSTLIVSAAGFKDAMITGADLIFTLAPQTSGRGAAAIVLDARDLEAAAAIVWREIALYLARRDASRWKSLRPPP